MSAARIFPFRASRFGPPGPSARSLGKPAAKFPAAVATDSDLIIAVDLQQTTLAVPLNATDLSMSVANPSVISAYGLLTIDAEIVKTAGPPAGSVVPIQRGFDGTTPATHSAGAPVSGFIDAYHHNGLVSEIEAIEQALGPNLSNVPASSSIVTSAYNFTPQAPGGSLGVGSNVIAMNPMPVGLAVGNFLLISGGAGAQEAVPITGLSAGSAIVTCANTHSGAWTIQSATGGVQEAMVVASTLTATNPFVYVNRPATFYAVANVPSVNNYQTITLKSQGKTTLAIQRAQSYLSGNLLFQDGSGGASGFEVHDLLIMDQDPTGAGAWQATGGASIHLKNGTFSKRVVDNVSIVGPYIGVQIDGAVAVEIANLEITWTGNSTATPLAGIQIGGRNNATTGPPTAVCISDVQIAGTGGAANFAVYGIQILCADGVQVINSCITETQNGVGFVPGGPTNNQIDDVDLIGVLIDGSQGHNITFVGNASFYYADVTIRNSSGTMPTSPPPASAGTAVYLDPTCNIATLEMSDSRFINAAHSGLEIYSTSLEKAEISGCRFTDNGSNNLGFPAVILGAGVSNTLITGCTMGNFNSWGHQVNAVTIVGGGGSNHITIVGNDMAVGFPNPPIVIQGTPPANFIIANNAGLADTPPVLASAATLTFPLMEYPRAGTVSVTGTTGVTAVAGLFAGQSGLLVTTTGAVTFTAGPTIGNTLTTTQGLPYTWYFDGTRLWIR